jgi:hypothetical protein
MHHELNAYVVKYIDISVNEDDSFPGPRFNLPQEPKAEMGQRARITPRRRHMKKPLWYEVVRVLGCADSATGNHLLRCVLNNMLKEFGVMTSILIDSKSKTIAIEVELKGEDRPIRIQVKEYVIEPKGDGSLLRIGNISFSREWMDVIGKKFLADAKLSIPLPPDLLEQIL